MRSIFLAIFVIGSLSLVPSGVRAQQVRTIARVLATGDVSGRFARPVCVGREHLRASDDAAFTYALTRAAAEEDGPMVVDTGGLTSPNGVARYAASHRPSSLATMVRLLGYRALAVGLSDLSAPREGMIAVASELRERNIPMVASNLRCLPGSMALCDVLVDGSDGPSVHIVNNRSTAVLSVLRPNTADFIAPDLAEGLTFDPPEEAVTRLTRIARDLGAQLVIAVVDAGIEGGPIEFAANLPEEARPDLILVSGSHDLLFARPRTVNPVLVGTPVDDAVEIRIRESLELREGYEMLAQPLGGRGVTVAAPVLDWIERIGPSYCEAWGQPLAGASLDEPLDVDGALELVGRVLREQAGADIAIVNRDALDGRWRQAREDSLTASDLYILLQYDEPLQVAEVDSVWLGRLATAADSRGDLVTTGFRWTGSGATRRLRIGGHLAEARARYRVVTLRFLAAGGDGALPALTNNASWSELGDTTIRSSVRDYLEVERSTDPRDALPDPAGTTEWVFNVDADLTFGGSTAQNPSRRCGPDTPAAMCVDGLVVDGAGATGSAYSTSQLSQSDLLVFGLQLDIGAHAAAPDWTWENTASLLYRTAWTEAANEFAEAADQIRARSTLSWRGLRQQAEEQWYIPDPTVDVFIESEISEPASRDWHWFLTRPTAGLRFQLLDKLSFQVNGGAQFQPFDPTFEVEAGLGATLTLLPWDILKLGQQFFRWSFAFDYFVADLADQNRGALRGQMEVAFDLFGPLAINLRLNVLVQHEESQDVGAAVNATIGLRLGYLGRAVDH